MTASLSGGTPPPPILPRNLKKIKFLDVDPLEIARQLTIIDSRLFSKITVEECLNKAWPKKFNNRDMPNFTAIAAMSNAVTGWVAMSIVGQPDLRRRVAVIKHFIAVADVRRSTARIGRKLMFLFRNVAPCQTSRRSCRSLPDSTLVPSIG